MFSTIFRVVCLFQVLQNQGKSRFHVFGGKQTYYYKNFSILKSSKNFSNFGGTSPKFGQKLLKIQYFENWSHKSNFQKKILKFEKNRKK